MYRMRLHQGEGTPHSLQTPVGCWRTRNGSTTEDMKDLFFQLMKAVSQISCWVQSDSMIIEGGSLKRCGYGFLINICNETRRRGEGRLLPPSPDPGGQDIGWTDDASVFGHLIPVLFCKYILWCLVVTFHFLLTFVPSALLPFLCSSPARSSPHTCLSAVFLVSVQSCASRVPVPVLRPSCVPFVCCLSKPDYQKDRWKELLTGTYIHQCPSRCQFGPHVSTSTVLLSWEGRLSAVPQSSEHTPSPGVVLAHLNPGLNISVTVWHSWSGRSLPIVLRELLES